MPRPPLQRRVTTRGRHLRNVRVAALVIVAFSLYESPAPDGLRLRA